MTIQILANTMSYQQVDFKKERLTVPRIYANISHLPLNDQYYVLMGKTVVGTVTVRENDNCDYQALSTITPTGLGSGKSTKAALPNAILWGLLSTMAAMLEGVELTPLEMGNHVEGINKLYKVGPTQPKYQFSRIVRHLSRDGKQFLSVRNFFTNAETMLEYDPETTKISEGVSALLIKDIGGAFFAYKLDNKKAAV